MKTKKLKKIIEESVSKSIESMRSNEMMLKSSSSKDVDLSEYDSEVSDKFKKLISNIINYAENLNINISNSRISISCDSISGIKNQTPNTLSNSITLRGVSGNNFLEICISNGIGFRIGSEYAKNTNYKDHDMYNDLLPLISNKLKEINAENFNQIWFNVMKESGMLRDSNLDDILES